MNSTVHALAGWRSWRKFVKHERHVASYYQHRIDEAPFAACVVFFCGVGALFIILIAIISRSA